MDQWKPPKDFPSLREASWIAIDVETCDPNLKTHGPGGARGKDGYLIGVSIATDTGIQGYWPMRHEEGPNLDEQQVLNWLKGELSGHQPKVGANILYDLEWLRAEGVSVTGPKIDIQIAEPLLDEELPSYSLEALSQRHLGEGKDESLMIDTAKKAGIKESEVKQYLWKLPSWAVGPYGEKDAVLALEIFKKQNELLIAEDLWEVFQLESALVDLLLDMRFKGVPVNIQRAEMVVEQLKKETVAVMGKLRKLARTEVDIWSGKNLSGICDRIGLSYPSTEKGNPSMDAKWLATQEHEFFKLVSQARKLDRCGHVFVEKKILDLQSGGRLYPTFKQVRSDDGGTRSGRFASNKPNLQQVPSRDPVYSKMVRSIFVPEDGCRWLACDYSQQEPRVTLHYASLLGLPAAEDAVLRYKDNPRTDYHTMVKDMVLEKTAKDIGRKPAKDLNLGLSYGQGMVSIASQLGLTQSQAEELFEAYHKSVPYVKLLGKRCSYEAQKRGWVKTLLGRKCHFNKWGPSKFGSRSKPLTREEALKAYGTNIKRWFTHKAMNRIVQGSSADMMKKAMLDAYRVGYVPHITIHDEMDNSIESDKQIRELVDIMQNCVKLKVPLIVDAEVGPNWGELEDWDND